MATSTGAYVVMLVVGIILTLIGVLGLIFFDSVGFFLGVLLSGIAVAVVAIIWLIFFRPKTIVTNGTTVMTPTGPKVAAKVV